MEKEYISQAATDARRAGYGSESYWDYLDQHAIELFNKFESEGDEMMALTMLTRSLSDALQGNNGD